MSSFPKATQKITIIFRGLLVFHREQNHFEIGVLPAPEHNFRVNIIKGESKESVQLNHGGETWALEVSDPVSQGIETHESEGDFNRLEHADDRDFRWMINIEGNEFYNDDLTQKMDTRRLKPVMRISQGKFYTSKKSPALDRKKGGGDFELFGSIAADTGCDIALAGEGARLVDVETGHVIFNFKAEPNTVYEIVNTPPDPEGVGPNPVHPDHQGHQHGNSGQDRATREEHKDHFQFYYRLFPDQRTVKFEFKQAAGSNGNPGIGAPSPNPFLCGKILLGEREEPLR